MTNLTLAVDSDILRSARKIAIDMDTSVSAMVRGFLADLVEAQKARRREKLEEEFFSYSDAHPFHLNGEQWNREGLYDR